MLIPYVLLGNILVPKWLQDTSVILVGNYADGELSTSYTLQPPEYPSASEWRYAQAVTTTHRDGIVSESIQSSSTAGGPPDSWRV